MANENGHSGNGNGNNNGNVELRLHYSDISVARAEIDGLVKLALFKENEPRQNKPISIPESVGLGVLRFEYKNTYHLREFLKDFHEDGSFHCSVEVVPHYS
jgi:hypothetical protein